MVRQIPASELVLNKDNSVYHLGLHPHQIADDIIVVGDPARVALISGYFDEIEHKVQSREFVTHTGIYKGKRITALATGIGTDNIDIVLNELDALVNIDLETRTIKEERKSLNIVRLGTSGALQADIPIDSFVSSAYAFGIDGLLNFYKNNFSEKYKSIQQAFLTHTNYPKEFATPYFVACDSNLMQTIGKDTISGITATASGFYAPQGRSLRLPLAYPELNEKFRNFTFENYRLTNFEMETSALYGLSELLGHKALTICVIIANRYAGTFSANYKERMKTLIEQTLNRLTSIS
jgi:uridine phosphorylase